MAKQKPKKMPAMPNMPKMPMKKPPIPKGTNMGKIKKGY